MRVQESIYRNDTRVREKTAIALAINEVLQGPLTEYLNDQQSKLYRRVGIGGIVILIGSGLFLMGIGLVGGAVILSGVLIAGSGLYAEASQSPDITVNQVKKGYWTGYLIPSAYDGTIVYDATESVPRSEFTLQTLSDKETIRDAQERIESADDRPIVMPESENVELEITTALDEVHAELERTERHTVALPLVSASDPVKDALEYVSEDAEAESVRTSVAVDKEDAVGDLEALEELEELAATEDAKDELEALSQTSRELVAELSRMQQTAVELLNNHIRSAANVFGVVSYHFYCPNCQMGDIDSRLTLSDIEAGEWHCPTCRTTHNTEDIIPRHRIKDDLVNPIWDNLWIEKDDERRQIYENIEDQKTDLKEREFEQRREEIRTVADRIHDLRSRIRDLRTQAKAAEGTVDEIGELMVKYERLNEQRKQQFEAEVEDIYGEIEAQTERILEETRNEQQKRLEEAEKKAEKRAQLLREEERRRDVAKLMAQKEMVEAQMAQREELHKREELLETRGKLSFSDTINGAYYKKNQLLGATRHGGGN